MFRIKSYAKQQIWVDARELSKEREPAQIQVEQHTNFRWLQAKLGNMPLSGMILNWLQAKFAAKMVANEIICLKAM